MKKYIVFGYTNQANIDVKEEPTIEERKLIFDKWLQWKEMMGEQLISLGSPLINGVAIDETGVLDSPVSNLAGYMMIQAENQEHALDLLKKSPLFGKGHGQKYELFECVM